MLYSAAALAFRARPLAQFRNSPICSLMVVANGTVCFKASAM
jgi:hypothetical protein